MDWEHRQQRAIQLATQPDGYHETAEVVYNLYDVTGDTLRTVLCGVSQSRLDAFLKGMRPSYLQDHKLVKVEMRTEFRVSAVD